MDPISTVLQWSGWIQKLPAGMEVMRLDDGETDGFFAVEIWIPDDTQSMAKALLALPSGSRVMAVINEVDEELGVRISIPKE